METNPRDQLHEVSRLQAETTSEMYHAPAWAFPMMSAATIAFFAFYAFAPKRLTSIGGIVWTAFVAAWVLAIRRTNRATARHEVTWSRVRNYVLLAAAINIAVLVVLASFGRHAWLFLGIAFACVGTVSGTFSVWRARHS